MGRSVTRIKLPYINEYRDSRGKLRRYVRMPGRKRVPLPGQPGSAAFMESYQAAIGAAPPVRRAAIPASYGVFEQAVPVEYSI